MGTAMARRTALAVLAAAIPGALVKAQPAYPGRPVRLLVGFPPGGSTDIFARAVADSLSAHWGQTVVVENRGGANGIIATTALAQSPPDGYTLMFTISSHVTNRAINSKLTYNPLTDFVPIALVARAPFAIVANASFAPRTVQELIDLAKKKPHGIDYGSPGVGSSQHLAMELFNNMAGIHLNHVAYRGGALVLTDLIAGTIPLALLTTTQVMAQVQSRDSKLRILAVTSTKRSSLLPDVPTVAEAGVPGYDADVWFGMIAPAGTPPAIIRKIAADIAQGLDTDAMRKNFSSQDARITFLGPEDFARLMHDEDTKWSRIIKDAGIRIE